MNLTELTGAVKDILERCGWENDSEESQKELDYLTRRFSNDIINTTGISLD